MQLLKKHIKRIATDTAGYLLIVAAILTGWLPGPGGIPLALVGLGLLSINNKWAHDLRELLLKSGSKFVKTMFPADPLIQWLYDILVVILLVLVAWLEARHSALWQVSLGIGLFFIALFLALTNRDRLQRLKDNRKR